MDADAIEIDGVQPQESEGTRDETRVAATRESVLLVEDDVDSRETLVEMLSDWGYEAVPVSSAEEAEYAARRRPFLAAVVDVFLPGRNGASLIARLRERYPDSLLIAMSALGDPAMARHCKVVGADLFIEKPFRAEDLAEALRTRHETWH
ncbi:MAG TPA: response regulator [Myxococcaceae bacterium]|nr:response regulator [Myxococcaceae bacterium]